MDVTVLFVHMTVDILVITMVSRSFKTGHFDPQTLSLPAFPAAVALFRCATLTSRADALFR